MTGVVHWLFRDDPDVPVIAKIPVPAFVVACLPEATEVEGLGRRGSVSVVDVSCRKCLRFAAKHAGPAGRAHAAAVLRGGRSK